MTAVTRLRSACYRAARVALPLLLLSATVGCDTVAEISITTRNFTQIDSSGLVNALNCQETDVNVTVRFTPLDEQGLIIKPNERIGDGTLLIEGVGANFDSDDIEFSTQSVLYPSPDQECVGDGDCTAPFSCEPVNPFNPGNSRTACGIPIVIETFQGSVDFDAGRDTKSILLMMDYSQSLEGVAEDGSFDATRSTDPQNKRISSAQAFILGFRRTAVAEDSRMCVLSFGGEGRAAVSFWPDPSSCLSSSYENALTQVSRMTVGETGASPIWSAILVGIEDLLSNAGGDRKIVLFTDGLDDGSLTDTFDTALNSAIANEVEIHVIQLDNPPLDGDERPYIGPEDQFAELACQTGGSFQYAQAPEDLRSLFTALATDVAGRYEANLQIGQLGVDTVGPGRYRVATALTANLLGERRSFQFAGDQTDPTSSDIVDRRLTVFKRPVPARPADEPDDTETPDDEETTE